MTLGFGEANPSSANRTENIELVSMILNDDSYLRQGEKLQA